MALDVNTAPPIIDLEASGFGRGSYPIEVGIALENREIHSFLIKPEDDWTHWSDEAEQIHGISREQLQAEGMCIEDIALKLNECCVVRRYIQMLGVLIALGLADYSTALELCSVSE